MTPAGRLNQRRPPYRRVSVTSYPLEHSSEYSRRTSPAELDPGFGPSSSKVPQPRHEITPSRTTFSHIYGLEAERTNLAKGRCWRSQPDRWYGSGMRKEKKRWWRVFQQTHTWPSPPSSISLGLINCVPCHPEWHLSCQVQLPYFAETSQNSPHRSRSCVTFTWVVSCSSSCRPWRQILCALGSASSAENHASLRADSPSTLLFISGIHG